MTRSSRGDCDAETASCTAVSPPPRWGPGHWCSEGSQPELVSQAHGGQRGRWPLRPGEPLSRIKPPPSKAQALWGSASRTGEKGPAAGLPCGVRLALHSLLGTFTPSAIRPAPGACNTQPRLRLSPPHRQTAPVSHTCQTHRKGRSCHLLFWRVDVLWSGLKELKDFITL